MLVERLDVLQRLEAVHAREPDVEEHHVDLVAAQRLEALGCVGGVEDVELLLEDQAARLAEALVIVHDEDNRPDIAHGFE
jgi:hypothetical protein